VKPTKREKKIAKQIVNTYGTRLNARAMEVLISGLLADYRRELANNEVCDRCRCILEKHGDGCQCWNDE